MLVPCCSKNKKNILSFKSLFWLSSFSSLKSKQFLLFKSLRRVFIKFYMCLLTTWPPQSLEWVLDLGTNAFPLSRSIKYGTLTLKRSWYGSLRVIGWMDWLEDPTAAASSFNLVPASHLIDCRLFLFVGDLNLSLFS